MPAMSISSMAMRNTIEASTAFGMYCSGAVRNTSTMMTMAPAASWASWLRPPALSTICVLVGLPLTTYEPLSVDGDLGEAEPDEVGVLAERLVVLGGVGP